MIEGNKLIRIEYNNKIYDILVDETHTKHFIEVRTKDGKEKFYHPNLGDLIKLNLIYNTSKDEKFDKRKKYRFKQETIKNLKIKYNNIKKLSKHITKLTNIAVIAAVIITLKNKIDDYDIPEIAIGTVEIKNNDELDEFNINQVTFDEVRNTLDQNTNFKGKYKNLANEYIDLLEKKLPNIDLRLLNENLKDMNIDLCYGQILKDENAAGEYNSNTRVLSICTGYDEKTFKSIYFHELTHALTTLNRQVSFMDEKIIRNQKILKQYEQSKTYGEAIDEGFTEIITNFLLSRYNTMDDYLKDDSKKFVGYSTVVAPTCYKLVKLTYDEYSIYDYVNGNVEEFANILKKYDLDGIIDYLDVIKRSDDSTKIKIADSYEFKTYTDRLENLLDSKYNNAKYDDESKRKIAYILSKDFQ